MSVDLEMKNCNVDQITVSFIRTGIMVMYYQLLLSFRVFYDRHGISSYLHTCKYDTMFFSW